MHARNSSGSPVMWSTPSLGGAQGFLRGLPLGPPIIYLAGGFTEKDGFPHLIFVRIYRDKNNHSDKMCSPNSFTFCAVPDMQKAPEVEVPMLDQSRSCLLLPVSPARAQVHAATDSTRCWPTWRG
jgi:hypothetical protein